MRPGILSANRRSASVFSLLLFVSALTLAICLLLVARAAPANGDLAREPEAEAAASARERKVDAGVGGEGAYDNSKLGNRLFVLIESIHRKSDISRESAEKVMARKLVRDQSREEVYVLAERTKEGNAYRIKFEEENDIDRNIWVTLGARSSAAESSGCILGFSSFHQEMERIGYEGSRMIDHHGPGNGWMYAKNGIYIKAYYKYGVYCAPGEDISSKNLCVETVTIN
ncbi:hypothetical protein [Luteimonas suaedae]|uniref:hypothetical protein n=1 Tax=Luteimonas suaedae TaxID=2605430 RepID=UPI0011F02DDD|nr:hypothetical protein [Luteimonas suaedae]